jgi:Icc-related predicted phosphoesterase
VRVAAAGDLHYQPEQAGRLAAQLEGMREAADLLLVAGDLTERGHPEEAAGVARELGAAGVPVVAVLGNHDHDLGRAQHVAGAMEAHGVRVLQGEGVLMDVRGTRVGIAGVTGFAGGFPGACASDFGEALMKDFVAYARDQADRLEAALRGLDADLRIALLHYSPCRETLRGEPAELYPFLGSYLLAEAIDRAGADLVLHGHAHFGREEGATPGGTPVRNVALPVIRHTIRIFLLPPSNGPTRGAGRRPAPAWTPFSRHQGP